MNIPTNVGHSVGSDEDIVDVLTAISVVSRRLARTLAASSKSDETHVPQYFGETDGRVNHETG